MKIFITGGTGFVGTSLTRALTAQGHQVTLLTRAIKPERSLPPGASFLEGNPKEPGSWQKVVPDHEAFVNLAGASIFSRWTEASKREMRDSRILTTRNVVSALADRKGSETLLLSTSAIGYYGFHEDEEISEETPPGTDFFVPTLPGLGGRGPRGRKLRSASDPLSVRDRPGGKGRGTGSDDPLV